MHRYLASLVSAVGLGTLLIGVASEAPERPPARKVDFNRDVLPILSEHCFRCHGPDSGSVAAGLRLDMFETATADRGGFKAVDPGKPESSRILARAGAKDEAMRMPPMASGMAPLSREQLETLRLWILDGAKYKKHWAFVAPDEPARPAVSDPKWPKQEMDYFVLASLDGAGLKPARQADLRTLARRASLSLTGLPPSPEEIEGLLKSKDYGAFVDRLLASPRYGEHQARYWLDAVRYGDTHGLHLDNERSIWPYRDWVVRALNDDLSFDQFALWQIAGDLLPEPTTEQLIASGYVRLNPTTAEGGAIEEEFLVKNTFDRVDTFGTVFLGMTVGCAKCHDHKYDPITQKEYYGLFAYFNSTADAPLDGNLLAPAPAIKAATPEQERELDRMRSSLRALEDRVDRQAALAWIKNERVAPPVFGKWELSPVYSAETFDLAHATAFAPEIAEVAWTPTDIALGRLKAEIIKKVNSAVYVRTTIQSENANEIVLRLGSDDSIKLWANGKLVHDNKALRALAPDQDSVKVPLAKGANTILIKVVNAAGGDGIYVAYGDPRAERIDRAFKATQRPQMTADEQRELAAVVLTFGPETESGKRYRETTKQLADFEAALPFTLVAKEMEKPREAYLLRRGEYDLRGEVVPRHIPAVFGTLPATSPNNRLGLAQWLVSDQDAMLARVTVNRIWQHHFGTPIVQSAENFGVQGDWPTHPDLLDHLAVKFRDEGWSMKKLHKAIVTSAAFMQESVVTEEKLAKDPENKLLSRGPRFRLDAEVLRDYALFVSGTLVEKLGGKGVKTYQPEGLWEAVGYPTSNTSKYVQDHGEALYRRSLYLFWKRTSPPPTMSVFDAPNRESCIVNRSRTNTPLQALVGMNGVQFVEASRNMAQRVMLAKKTDDERARYAFLLATGRPPSDQESRIIVDTLRKQLAEYKADHAQAEKLLKVGESARDESLNGADHAAWTMVCNMLLNLDEAVTQH
jgi:hypothetical protein